MTTIKKDVLIIEIPTGGASEEYYKACVFSIIQLLKMQDNEVDAQCQYYLLDLLQHLVQVEHKAA